MSAQGEKSLQFFEIYVAKFSVIVETSGGDSQGSYWDENYSSPYFDNTTRRDITVTIGQTALLHCRVRNLGDRAVSRDFSFISLASPASGALAARAYFAPEPWQLTPMQVRI